MWLCWHEEEEVENQSSLHNIKSSLTDQFKQYNHHQRRQHQRRYFQQQPQQQRRLLDGLASITILVLLGLTILISTTVTATEMTTVKMTSFSRGWKQTSKTSSYAAFATTAGYIDSNHRTSCFASSLSSLTRLSSGDKLCNRRGFVQQSLSLSQPNYFFCHTPVMNKHISSCYSTATNNAESSSSLSSLTSGDIEDNDNINRKSSDIATTQPSFVDSGDASLDDEDDFTMDDDDDEEEDNDEDVINSNQGNEDGDDIDAIEFTTMPFQGSFSSDASPSTNNVYRKQKRKKQDTNRNRGWMDVNWESIGIGTTTGTLMPSINEKDNDIASIDSLHPVTSPDHPSPVEMVVVRDRIVYVKRDDLLHLRGSRASGNKARKFLPLNEMKVVPDKNGGEGQMLFPDVVVSYGGPQSNAMVAIAAIVHSKNEELKEIMGIRRTDDDEDSLLDIVQRGLDELDPETDFEEEDTGNDLLSMDEAAFILELDDEKDQQQGSTGSSFSQYSSFTGHRYKKKRFVYYTKKIPRYLRKQPNGNLLRAMSLGMEIVELSNVRYAELFGGDYGGSPIAPKEIKAPIPGRSLWIPQGGACGVAVPGARLLAKEILTFWAKQGRDVPLSVCVPGGTCTTGMLLHREMTALLKQREAEGQPELDIQIVVVPCVGDDTYAMRQMMALDENTGGPGRASDTPTILRPHADGNYGSSRRRLGGYFVFGEPAAAILQTFQEMKESHHVFLDLLYGAPAWSLLLQHWRATPSNGVGKALRGKRYIDDSCPIAGRQVMYVHSGGQEGIASQLTRYKHKGLIDSSELQ